MKFITSKTATLTTSVLVGALILSACVNTQKNSDETNSDNNAVNKSATFTPRAENQYLSQEQAFKRSDRVSNVSYKLDFNLSGDEIFSASSSINFDLSNNKQPLTLDLSEAKISKLVVNGSVMAAEDLEKITIAGLLLCLRKT